VLDDLVGRVDLVLDGGPTGIGLESTVLDVSGTSPVLLRPGGLPVEALEQVLGEAVERPEHGAVVEMPKSPGMKYTHYSPRARLILVDKGSTTANVAELGKLADRLTGQGARVGLLCTEETFRQLNSRKPAVVLGPRADKRRLAANLFAGLRELDAQGCDLIIAEGISRTGYGLGVMDRLTRAASEIISEGG